MRRHSTVTSNTINSVSDICKSLTVSTPPFQDPRVSSHIKLSWAETSSHLTTLSWLQLRLNLEAALSPGLLNSHGEDGKRYSQPNQAQCVHAFCFREVALFWTLDTVVSRRTHRKLDQKGKATLVISLVSNCSTCAKGNQLFFCTRSLSSSFLLCWFCAPDCKYQLLSKRHRNKLTASVKWHSQK